MMHCVPDEMLTTHSWRRVWTLLGADAHWTEMGTRPWSSWTSAHRRTALKDDGTLCSNTEPPSVTRTGPLLRTQTCGSNRLATRTFTQCITELRHLMRACL